MLYSLIKKLHASAGSVHHQVFLFELIKIILYNSRGGVFDGEISTSKQLSYILLRGSPTHPI